jgi:hypothetical protein
MSFRSDDEVPPARPLGSSPPMQVGGLIILDPRRTTAGVLVQSDPLHDPIILKWVDGPL